jgi:hypothetical protein
MSSEHTKVPHTELISVIKNVLAQEDNTIRLIYQKNTGEKFLYPPLDKMLYLNVEKVLEILDYIVQTGFMEKKTVETLRFCPVCFSYEIIPTEHCPNCSSTNISRGRVIEHFSCGYRNLETVFLLNTGLECPRCHKQLLIEGKDYSRGKLMYKCHACGNLFDTPIIDYHCQKCGEYFPVEELGETIVYHYEVRDSKMESIKATLKTLESIDANLRENGYTTKYCTQVTGASGISYDIDLWATNPAKNDSILVETYLLEETINVDEILRLQALGYDLGAKKIVILTYSKLDQKAEYLANYYGMKRIIPEKTGEVTKEIMVELI